jgi:hypothetical protein
MNNLNPNGEESDGENDTDGIDDTAHKIGLRNWKKCSMVLWLNDDHFNKSV